MHRRVKVYIAGAYSADNVLDVFNNMRIGMRAAVAVFDAGCSPWCPFWDFHLLLMRRDDQPVTIEALYDYSLAWLSVSDAVYVAPNPANGRSKGTVNEINKATGLGIPVLDCLDKLKEWAVRHPKSAVAHE